MGVLSLDICIATGLSLLVRLMGGLECICAKLMKTNGRMRCGRVMCNTGVHEAQARGLS